MSDGLMQSIAAQHNLVKQLFRNAWGPTDSTYDGLPPERGALCGHATLAA